MFSLRPHCALFRTSNLVLYLTSIIIIFPHLYLHYSTLDLLHGNIQRIHLHLELSLLVAAHKNHNVVDFGALYRLRKERKNYITIIYYYYNSNQTHRFWTNYSTHQFDVRDLIYRMKHKQSPHKCESNALPLHYTNKSIKKVFIII